MLRLVIHADDEWPVVALDDFGRVLATVNPWRVEYAGLEATLSARENVAVCN